jgi:hypothetical protein
MKKRSVVNVKYNQLGDYALPKKTSTYQPVGHQQLIDKVIELAKPEYGKPKNGRFRVAGGGRQLFAHLDYDVSDKVTQHQQRLSIGIRNSYDKSIAVGICSGASIIVCDNLMFVGDIVRVRKHTVNVWNDLDEIIKEGIQAAEENFETSRQDRESLSNIVVTQTNAAHVLGELFVNFNVLTSNQLNIAVREWKAGNNDAKHPFAERNAWSLYNACTESLKVAHPGEQMDRQVKLHEFFQDNLIS